ncbi:dinuclear metal center protein, YbgI/SA1388 family [Desulfonatronum thiosulfatophilum]|uniref:GTP cyclohydrolase 1 type 2 homolog n=1 Tax=Desulfonatronum thiosulfatophilum TaxID=617002 RepID=A0A1G6A9U8_9BACT|nr:Nif3-like dinuclear metal center hexameric protein [Desulfonatronum thiosulfatophilum]SDB05096.1 dinuclear metal center protein, YbgI/SA1388 family [Desulfonatronum thiosulfatophilum]
MHVHDLIAKIEMEAPPECAASWDKGGVQVAGGRSQVHKLAVGLDPTPGLIDQALEWGADFILVHHPLAMKPDFPSRPDSRYHHVLGALFRHDAWLYAAHTSLDTQPDGPVQWLARALILQHVRVLEQTGKQVGRWFRILGATDAVAGVGRALAVQSGIEIFQQHAQTLEVVCGPAQSALVRKAVDDDASGTLRMISQELDTPSKNVGFGFVGELPSALSWSQFVQTVEGLIEEPLRTVAGVVPDQVRRVACCPGSGASLLDRAAKSGAQVYITGDFKYHDAQMAEELGLLVADVGHFRLEERMMAFFAKDLRLKLEEFAIEVAFIPGHDAFTHRFLEERPA